MCCEDGIRREGLTNRIDLAYVNPLIETYLISKADSTQSKVKFYVYQTLVEEYTGKNLTFATDILNAFAGIIAAHEPTYGKFVTGLPESVIDLALLWVPIGVPQRRKAFSNRKASEVGIQPSWSWAGWEGPVYHPLWPFRQAPEESICSLKSLVQAFQTESRGLNSLRALHRHEALRPRQEVKLSDNDTVKVLLTLDMSILRPTSDQILSFWASTAQFSSLYDTHFSLGTELSLKVNSKTIAAAQLSQGLQPCGVIFGVTPRSLLTAADTKLDLVLLSENENLFFREPLSDLWPKLNIDTSIFPVVEWCFLNVLLVRSNEDTAERVAIGMVHRVAWMRASQKIKLIKLI